MALTAFQQSICRLLAPSRLARESYVAGGVALNVLLAASRRSRDVDLFHDTTEAVAKTIEIEQGRVSFHQGRIGSAWPTFPGSG